MPIYEYRCPNGHRFEVFQKMADAPKGACEVCGAGPLEKLLFPIAVHFKGSGFYSTDYGSRKAKATRDGDSSSSTETSTDKPAEKSTSESKPKPAADSGS